MCKIFLWKEVYKSNFQQYAEMEAKKRRLEERKRQSQKKKDRRKKIHVRVVIVFSQLWFGRVEK